MLLTLLPLFYFTRDPIGKPMASINDLATAAIASSSKAAAAAAEGTHAGTGAEMARGAFIVLEGLDRSGKTTQVKLLEQRFVEEGMAVKTMRFPGEFVLTGGERR